MNAASMTGARRVRSSRGTVGRRRATPRHAPATPVVAACTHRSGQRAGLPSNPAERPAPVARAAPRPAAFACAGLARVSTAWRPTRRHRLLLRRVDEWLNRLAAGVLLLSLPALACVLAGP